MCVCLRDINIDRHISKSLKMIKLFSLKQQKKDEESAGGNRAGAGGKKASAAQLRIQKGRLVGGSGGLSAAAFSSQSRAAS